MSESYISDLGARSYGSKDGMITYSSNRNKFQTLITQKKKSSRMAYATMSELDIFLESLKKVKGMTDMLYSKVEDIARNIDELYPNTIKYRNAAGIVYGYKYFLAQTSIRKDKDLYKELFEDAEKNNVLKFDVIRYYRYLTEVIGINEE